jgi:uncharacterized protein (DUF1800 family)
MTAARIAANRFGLGARPGEVAKIAQDPRGWLSAQIKPLAPLPYASTPERIIDLLAVANNPMALQQALKQAIPLYRQDIIQRSLYAIKTSDSFAERMVQFWSNHLAVSVERAQCAAVVVPYENEAIRPHVFGKFSDMLLASARHPAMLMYLDNARSLGPNSRAVSMRALRRELGTPELGLNENYAREVMELHTLGVKGGYTQADVTTLAKILTGWTLKKRAGTFQFLPAAHEPGVQTILGQSFAQEGEAQGVAALQFLAKHPATAVHLATKLVRHFCGDIPVREDIATIARVFLDTQGDLAAVSKALIALPSAWAEQPVKYKSPQEHVISALRAVGAKSIDEGILASFEVLGQRTFGAPSPQGWPDTEADWLSGEGALRRIEWAQALAQKLPATLDARKIAEDVLGEGLGAESAFVINGAPSPQAAIALLFIAPEFQRR